MFFQNVESGLYLKEVLGVGNFKSQMRAVKVKQLYNAEATLYLLGCS